MTMGRVGEGIFQYLAFLGKSYNQSTPPRRRLVYPHRYGNYYQVLPTVSSKSFPQNLYFHIENFVSFKTAYIFEEIRDSSCGGSAPNPPLGRLLSPDPRNHRHTNVTLSSSF
jgi:hypothetical protein